MCRNHCCWHVFFLIYWGLVCQYELYVFGSFCIHQQNKLFQEPVEVVMGYGWKKRFSEGRLKLQREPALAYRVPLLQNLEVNIDCTRASCRVVDFNIIIF